MRLLVLYRAECPETTAALSAPCPASYSTPSPHLICCFAPYTLLHPTSTSVPVHRHEYDYEYEQYPAHLCTTAADQYTKRTTVPHTSTVLYCTVLAPPR